jgi:hypothetical protein
MSAGHHLADAFDRISNRSNAAGATMPRPFGTHRACCREILRLTNENARLADELVRARATTEDLTKSTDIWIRLYEALLARARRPPTLASNPSMEVSRS